MKTIPLAKWVLEGVAAMIWLGGALDGMAETENADGAEWTFFVTTNGEATVTAGPKSGDVIIPDTLGGCPVTRIGTNAFASLKAISSVTIPSSVLRVESGAFSGCSGLTTINIENGLQYLGKRAFDSCSGLTNLTIPNSVTNIGEGAFSWCLGLREVSLGTGLKRIEDSAFRFCRYLDTLIIPDTVTYIGNSAFQSCYGLVSLTLGESLEHIGNMAFEGARQLTSVAIPGNTTFLGSGVFAGCNNLSQITVTANNPAFTSQDEVLFSKDMTRLFWISPKKVGPYEIPSEVEHLEDFAFYYCRGLESLSIPDSVTSIGSSALEGCVGLQTITLPQNLQSIGYAAFWGSGLTTVEIPASVTNMGGSVFCYCEKLTQIQVDDANPSFASKEGVLFSKDMKTLLGFPGRKSGRYTIPDIVTRIDEDSFRYARELTCIVIPNSVTNIGYEAFYGCSKLKVLCLPESIVYIGAQAFDFCNSLTTMYVPASWEGKRILKGVPSGCTVIYGARWEYVEEDLWTFVIRDGEAIIVGGPDSGDVNLPGVLGECPVTAMENTFVSCTNLMSVTIPDGISTIGDYALYDCRGLESLILPASVTYIGESAFFSCSGLSTLTIPESVTHIGNSAVADCTGLKTLFVPEAWEGTTMLDETQVPAECKVIYGSPESVNAKRYSTWLQELGKTAEELPMDDDTDNDGASNWEECVACTDPLDAQVRFEAQILFAGGTITVEPVIKATNRVYQVLGTAELSNDVHGEAVWIDVTDEPDLSQTGLYYFRMGVDFAE